MSQPLDQATLNAYSDLLGACLSPAFDGKGLSFTRKIIKGQPYWYLSAKVGRTPTQAYIGPDNEQTFELIAREKQLWEQGKPSRSVRARLVNMLLAGGALGPTPQEGKILRMLERAGVFLAGGVLVGTPAFRTMSMMLGVTWENQFATRDLDIAIDTPLAVAVKPTPINIREILYTSGMGFIPVPMLNPKMPSTAFKMRGGEFSVELLTPETGKPSGSPIPIPAFNTMAEPLRYLDYLLEKVQPAAIPFDIGILVNLPDPARFAIHKLVISERRPAAFIAKSAKDIDQARQLLEILLDIRPGAVAEALEAIEPMGKKFTNHFRAATKNLPTELQNELSKWS